MDENFGENFRDPKKMNKIFGISRNIFLLIILVLIWIAIIAIFYGPKIVTYFGVAPTAVTGEARLGIFPLTSTCQEGASCEVEIRVDTASTNVVAVRAIVKFDENVFQATSVDVSGSSFTHGVENEIDNNIGEIRITRGQHTPGINNSNALVAKIIFTVKAGATAGNTTISFGTTSAAPMGNSDVIKDNGVCPVPEQPCSGATELYDDSRGHSATITIEAKAYNPDIDNNGSVDMLDATEYVRRWRNQDPTADVDNNNSVDMLDATEYVRLWRQAQ